MGITWRCVAALTSSMAIKFSGSAMARYSSLRVARTGTTWYFWAMFLGRIWAISGESSMAFKSA